MAVSLASVAAALSTRGVELAPERVALLERYADLLREWNERVNLTAITAPDEIATKHFLDSLTLLVARPPRAGARLVDVGTGAGFPGLALAIARPDVRATLVESVGKKVRFLEAVVAELGLRNVSPVQARAEELARDGAHRERYDVALARALPSLAANLELLLPFCRVGGDAVAYKGRVESELDAATHAATALGGEIVALLTTGSFGLGDVLPGRCLVIATKRRASSPRYPRSVSEMKRHPW